MAAHRANFPLFRFWKGRCTAGWLPAHEGNGFSAPAGSPPPLHFGPGTGQRIPGRRARRPVVTSGPRSAGVNDRCRRRVAGAARDAGGLGRPLNSHHIALSPSNTPTGHAIGRAAPPPTRPRLRIGCRPRTARPAARPFSLCAAGCAGDPWPGARPASARPAEPRCRRSSSPNHSVHIRGAGGEGHRKGRGARCDGLGQSQAPLAERGLPRPPGRGAGAWPSAAGTGARPAPPRPAQDPLLLWNGSGGQGLASPRGRLRAALPQLSLDCGEE